MHVKLADIDPEQRPAGALLRLIMRPSVRFFKFAAALMRFGKGKDIANLDCEEQFIPSIDDAPAIRTRIYRPKNNQSDTPLPGLLFLHGGGYAFGIPEMSTADYQALIETRACVIVAPDYRKSLEAPYPAAINDCYSALMWMKNNALALGIRQDQLIVMGQSAGGGLTAAVSLMARDRGEVNIAFQMPLYPMIDDRTSTGSAKDNNAPVWSSRHNMIAWDLYLSGQSKKDLPIYAAPARAINFSGLPPTVTFVGALDPFRDETLEYVERLTAAGIPVACQVFDGCYHAFDVVGANTKIGREAAAFLHHHFARAVDSHFAAQTQI